MRRRDDFRSDDSLSRKPAARSYRPPGTVLIWAPFGPPSTYEGFLFRSAYVPLILAAYRLVGGHISWEDVVAYFPTGLLDILGLSKGG
jgi:hypothetical protein